MLSALPCTQLVNPNYISSFWDSISQNVFIRVPVLGNINSCLWWVELCFQKRYAEVFIPGTSECDLICK